MLLRHAIGAVLRRLRLDRGKTLRELAEQSRISLPYLSEVERGRKEASSEILASLCRVLDISERRLLDEVSEEYGRLELVSGGVGDGLATGTLSDIGIRRGDVEVSLLVAA
jgi:transcriptional regulator with XRE-family HTH domain